MSTELYTYSYQLYKQKICRKCIYTGINLLYVIKDDRNDSFSSGNGKRHQVLLLARWLFLPDVPVTMSATVTYEKKHVALKRVGKVTNKAK